MKNFKRIFVAVITVVLMLSMTSCSMLFGAVIDLFDKDVAVMSTDAVTVDDKMMGFFFNDHIIDWYNMHSVYNGLFSVDFTKDLKTQQYGDTSKGSGYESMILGQFDGTWYDYFMKPVQEQVEAYVVYATAAKLEGISLTEGQMLKIEVVISTLNELLSVNGASYSDWYGKGVDEDDVRRCYELMFLAANFYDYYNDKLENEIEFDEIVEYRENNKDWFYRSDYLSYSIKVNRNEMTDEEYENACNTAITAAEAIAQAEHSDDFIYNIIEYEYMRDGYTTEEMPEYDVDLDLAIKGHSSTAYYGHEEGELNEFLFGASPAQSGDTTVIDEFDYKNGGEVFTATAYFVTDPMYYDRELTHSFAYLISEDEQHIINFRAEFEASENKTVDAFLDIAERIQSSANMSGANDIFEFYTYEKASAGCFNQSYRALNDWVESDERMSGDLSQIFEMEVSSTNYGGSTTVSTQYAIMLFDGHNEEGWYVQAYDGTVSEKLEEWYMSFLKEHTIKVSDEINNIEVTKCFANTSGQIGGGITIKPSGDGDATTSEPPTTVQPLPDGGIVVGPIVGGNTDVGESTENNGIEYESGAVADTAVGNNTYYEELTEDDDSEEESENKSDVKFEINGDISLKVPLNKDQLAVLNPNFSIGSAIINVSKVEYVREVCYTSRYGFTIYYPATPTYYHIFIQ